MNYWIFKLSEQGLYPDEVGKKYIYYNTHSTRVSAGDQFLYLDKTKKYSFTAAGLIKKVNHRAPTEKEKKDSKRVTKVFTALLHNIEWFDPPLTILPSTKEGMKNRSLLGIEDVNLLGWSHSMPRVDSNIFQQILDLSEVRLTESKGAEDEKDYSVEDSYGKAKIRGKLYGFRDAVLDACKNQCVVCGTKITVLLDAAHLSPFATDKKNRANPANGLSICKYCHTAMDKRLIAIKPDGELLVSKIVSDPIAELHFGNLKSKDRAELIKHANPEFLNKILMHYENFQASF
jgi:hypothetical protein